MEWFLTDVERLGGRQVNKMCGSIFCHRISEVGFGVGNIVYQVFNVLVIPVFVVGGDNNDIHMQYYAGSRACRHRPLKVEHPEYTEKTMCLSVFCVVGEVMSARVEMTGRATDTEAILRFSLLFMV